jgi:hypothetical protein
LEGTKNLLESVAIKPRDQAVLKNLKIKNGIAV